MSTSSPSSSSVQAARERLGSRLRALRSRAGLSGVTFSKRAGWRDATNVSKLENGRRPISAAHVRLWSRICGASEREEQSLLAEQASVASMWVTYQQLNQGGLSRAQQAVRDRYEKLHLMLTYQPRGFPGLLQTEAYTRGILEGVLDEQGVDEADRDADLAAAVAERLDRQSVLRRPGKRFLHVMEEWAVRTRVLPADVHTGQIRYLLDVLEHRVRLPSVMLGIIPLNADRAGMRPREGFIITDGKTVNVEVAMYQGVWDRLLALAVRGEQCVEILREALADIENR